MNHDGTVRSCCRLLVRQKKNEREHASQRQSVQGTIHHSKGKSLSTAKVPTLMIPTTAVRRTGRLRTRPSRRPNHTDSSTTTCAPSSLGRNNSRLCPRLHLLNTLHDRTILRNHPPRPSQLSRVYFCKTANRRRHTIRQRYYTLQNPPTSYFPNAISHYSSPEVHDTRRPPHQDGRDLPVGAFKVPQDRVERHEVITDRAGFCARRTTGVPVLQGWCCPRFFQQAAKHLHRRGKGGVTLRLQANPTPSDSVATSTCIKCNPCTQGTPVFHGTRGIASMLAWTAKHKEVAKNLLHGVRRNCYHRKHCQSAGKLYG